jgi:hypothetical protein
MAIALREGTLSFCSCAVFFLTSSKAKALSSSHFFLSFIAHSGAEFGLLCTWKFRESAAAVWARRF